MNHLRLKEMFFLVLLILLLEYNTVCLSCMEEERKGLLKLKAFQSWVDDENGDCCDWELVKCDNTTRRVTQLNLSQVYVDDDNRVLDVSLFLPFQQLRHLDLNQNHFSSLHNHQDLGRLKKLEWLILANNYFNNTSILQSLSALTSLTVLDLSYNDMNGSSLSDFGTGLCEMKNLQELDLKGNMLSGSIPSCFNNLTSLKVLDLSDNQLGGFLHPSLLSSLASLEFISLIGNLQFEGNLMITSLMRHGSQFVYLGLPNCNLNISTTELVRILANQYSLMDIDLSHNNLHGEFPNLLVERNPKLVALSLRNNSLAGHIHFRVGPLVNLSWFDASNNQIQGELQPNIGEVLSQLVYLNISSNELGGGIPTSIRNMKNLQRLDLSNNNLSGKLPERLGLSFQNYGRIRLSNNKLEGQISHTLLNSTGLYILDLSNNQFTGDLPSLDSQLNLVIFDISQNHISGRIPLEFCNSSLQYLDISQNQLSGPMPSCLFTIPSLQYLHLQHNKLTGPLPNPLIKGSDLFTLDLTHNNFSGDVPSWFGFLLNLSVLLLKGNLFSGSIPRELCLLKDRIAIMDLSHNNISGTIPSCFTNITFGRAPVITFGRSPEVTYLSHKIEGVFTGMDSTNAYIFPSPVPREKQFVQRVNVQEMASEEVELMMKSRTNSYKGVIITFVSAMDLSCNNLKGNIPLDIGALTEIRALNLSHNRLTGSIPNSLANLKQIESIDFSHNNLSGGIPSNLTSLYTLVLFNVSYNNLSGRVPEMVAQFSTFDETSYEGNPFLCGPPLLRKQCHVKTNLPTTTDAPVGGNDFLGIDPISFLASFSAAYVTYLLAFVIVLYINPYWRRRWFRFIDACLGFVFPFCSEAIYRREM